MPVAALCCASESVEGSAAKIAPAPVAAYVPFVKTGGLLHVAGQLPIGSDGLVVGKVGDDLDVESGANAARLCAINLLAQVKAACVGNLDALQRVVKITGFVNAVPEFTDHPLVVNGASQLLLDALGDAGRHARSAIGAGSLPLGAAVEVDGVFVVDQP